MVNKKIGILVGANFFSLQEKINLLENFSVGYFINVDNSGKLKNDLEKQIFNFLYESGDIDKFEILQLIIAEQVIIKENNQIISNLCDLLTQIFYTNIIFLKGGE